MSGTVKAAELRNRDVGLRPPAQTETTGTQRNLGYPPGGARVPGIIRAVNTATGVITWQRIRYKNTPPVVGSLEAYGDEEEGYPFETAVAADYEVWAWPVANGGPTTTTVPIFAAFRNGAWIIEIPLKPAGGVLPPGGQVPGCNWG